MLRKLSRPIYSCLVTRNEEEFMIEVKDGSFENVAEPKYIHNEIKNNFSLQNAGRSCIFASVLYLKIKS
jgi:hypothetical protein